jgi:hypothetical protein
MQIGWSVGFFEGLKAGLWRDKTQTRERIA